MGSMKELERALARAGRTDVGHAAGVAAGRLADHAANEGLLDVAYTTLDARCKPDFARGFLLYELYIRAAAFESVSE